MVTHLHSKNVYGVKAMTDLGEKIESEIVGLTWWSGVWEMREFLSGNQPCYLCQLLVFHSVLRARYGHDTVKNGFVSGDCTLWAAESLGEWGHS